MNPPLDRILLMSIKPQWVDAIVAGDKTYELRRRAPRIQEPTPAIIYSSKPDCCIRAKCFAEEVLVGHPEFIWEKVGERTGVTRDLFNTYFAGLDNAHAIRLSRVVRTRRVGLAELRREIAFVPPQSWSWADGSLPRALVGVL